MKIEVNQLTKAYGKTFALNQVSFILDQPKIYGLLGRNGAGKTTFMEILAGHILPTAGQININGKNPFDDEKLASSICLMKEGNNFDKELKVKQILKLYSFFYPNWDMDLAMNLVTAYNLNLNAKVKTLSKGMESALSITVGIASKAEVTIFDEPYIGLDAAARKKFYEVLLEEYEKYKRMIIFSTHLIDEVSLLFEEILILNEGKLILQEEAEHLRAKTCAVSGSVNEVEQFIANKKVLHTKVLAGTMLAYIYGNANEAMEAGLKAEGIPIQELMIYLTEREGA